MKKNSIRALAAAAIAAMTLTTCAWAEEQGNWAYAVLQSNSSSTGIGTVYCGRDYYAIPENGDINILNPASGKLYSIHDVAQIIRKSADEEEKLKGYRFDLPGGAVLGLTVNGTETVYWYGAKAAAGIVAQMDEAVLNADSGAVTVGTEIIAQPLSGAWAFAGFVMNSEDYHVGTVYYARDYYLAEKTPVNPNTGAAYSVEELESLRKGAEDIAFGYVYDFPADALMGISVAGRPQQVFWYNAEATAAIVAHADPLTLNEETGALTSILGMTVAEAIQ